MNRRSFLAASGAATVLALTGQLGCAEKAWGSATCEKPLFHSGRHETSVGKFYGAGFCYDLDAWTRDLTGKPTRWRDVRVEWSERSFV